MLLPSLCLQIPLGTFSRVFDVASIGDVVAPQHARGFVAGNLHRDLLWNAGANHVSHGSATQIVEEQIRNTRFFAGLFPIRFEILYWFGIPREQPNALRRFELAPAQQHFEPWFHVAIDRRGFRIAILRHAAVHVDQAFVEIDPAPFDCEQFARAHP